MMIRWHDDKAHGWGMKAFANGDRHEGEYCLDLRQGCGTYHWANGDCYEGDWEVRGTSRSPSFSCYAVIVLVVGCGFGVVGSTYVALAGAPEFFVDVYLPLVHLSLLYS